MITRLRAWWQQQRDLLRHPFDIPDFPDDDPEADRG
ncbi:hypothetical protein FHS43_000547 [Streptosporangium becharense]|uniref:Uncharacterized protein n=1 Tax=Streptosporangium becharense TaxID=1816182 RepID=A0A7W9MKJ6_9ACTN|nr:hypothetical protein [Streptosporangium becharense]MBB5823796.1 hypothetical protein [Streptosporangium becharense]